MTSRMFLVYVLAAAFTSFSSMGVAEEEEAILLGFPGVRPAAAVVPEGPPKSDLPEAALQILQSYETEAQKIRRKAEEEIRARRDSVIQKLQGLQDQYTREAKLDEAVAIRDRIRVLRFAHLNPAKNPGNMSRYAKKIGQTYYFDVLGSAQGSAWGTETFTCDSNLATAAVHSGILKPGQRGVVKVSIVESPERHTGSRTNGVSTMDFGPYPASFTAERPLPTDINQNADIPQDAQAEPLGEVLRGGIRLIEDFNIRGDLDPRGP